MKNRKQLMEAVKANGYKGEAKPEAVKSWLEAEGLELPEGVKFDEVWAKTVRISVTADAGEDVEVTDGSAPEGAAVDEDEDEEAPNEEPPAKSVRKSGGAQRRQTLQAIQNAAKGPAVHGDTTARRYDRAIREGKGWGPNNQRPVWQSAEQAHAFGKWFKTTILEGKAHSTGDNALGGALIPDEYRAELIELKTQYGAARRVAGVQTMSRDTLIVPRLVDDVTISRIAENGQFTSQNKPTFDNVQITASKLGGMLKLSNEVVNDSLISIGDVAARSFGRGFGRYEDEGYFLGANGYTGIIPTLDSASKSDAALSTGWGDYTVSKLHAWMGKLPAEAHDAGTPKIVCSRQFFVQVLQSVANSAGGTTPADLYGSGGTTWLGYQVEFSDVMPKTYSGDQISALFGVFEAGTKFGEVTGSNTIATSEHAGFEFDQIWIRATERIGMTFHDIGGDASMVIGLQD